MALLERIQVVVDSSAKGAIRGLNETAVAAEGMGARTKSASGMLALLDRTGLATSGKLGLLRNNVAETGTVMGGLEKSGIGTAQVLGTGLAVGAAAGGAALAAFALKGVAAFEEVTGRVRAFQRIVGGSAEDASKLVFVADTIGVSTDSMGRAFNILEKGIGNNTSKLSDFGIQVAHTKDGNTDMAGTLANIAEAYKATDDPAKKAAIRNEAFRRSGTEMIPILQKSREEILGLYGEADKQHRIFSQDDLTKGKDLAIQTQLLGSEVQGLEIELGKGLVPALTSVTHGVTEMLQSFDSATSSIGGVGAVIGYLADNVSGVAVHGFGTFGELFQGHFVNALKEGVHAIPGVGAAIGSLTDWLDTGSGASEKAATKAKEHAAAEVQRAAALKQAADAEATATAQIQGLVDGQLALEASERQLNDAVLTYNTALADATAKKGTDAAANKTLDDATFALKQQIQSTAEQTSKHAVEMSNITDKTQLARYGNEVYRQSLEQAANSSIPAVRAQALILLDALNRVGEVHAIPTITVDTQFAHAALEGLSIHFDKVKKEFQGGLGRMS